MLKEAQIEKRNNAAMQIQSSARMFKQKQKFQKEKQAAVKIQSVTRKFQQEKNFQRKELNSKQN